MNEDLYAELKSYINTLRNMEACLPKQEGIKNVTVVPFYLTLLELISNDPLYPIDFSGAQDALTENGPEQMGALLERAQNAFKFRESLLDMELPLAELEQFCRLEPYGFLLESRLLAKAAGAWRSRIGYLKQGHRRPAFLDLGIVPSLDLAYVEETATAHGLRIIDLPILITNTGEVPAFNVNLFLEILGATVVHPSGLQDIGAGKWTMPILPGIAANELHPLNLQVNHAMQAYLEVWLEYSDILSLERIRHQTNKTHFDLRVRSPVQVMPENPYILSGEKLPDDMLFANHPKLIERIRSHPLTATGAMWIVRGVMQTGKTTVLTKLRQKLSHDNRLLPVYLDMWLWWHSDREARVTAGNEQSPLSGMEALYEIAGSVHDGLRRLEVKDEEIDGFYRAFERKREMDLNEFTEYLSLVKRKTARHPVLLVDELDCWHRDEEYKGQAEALLKHMAYLVKNDYCTSVLTFQTWATLEWEKPIIHGLCTPFPAENIEMLSREDVVRLIGKSEPLLYSDMAVECVWRLTGGWPGLVQLLLFEVMQEVIGEAAKRGDKAWLIDVGHIKQAAYEIMTSSRYSRFVCYYLDSLPQAEWDFLRSLVTNNLIDRRTGYLNNVRLLPSEVIGESTQQSLFLGDADRQSFDALKDKQIFECKNNKHCRCAVGLMMELQALDRS